MSPPRYLPHHVLSLLFLWALHTPTEVSANLCRVTGGVLGMHWSSVLGLGWRPLARGNAGATCWQSCCLSPSCGAVWSLGGHCVQLSCSRDRGCAIDFLPQPHQESLGLLQMLDKGPVIQKRSVRQRRAHRTHPHVNTRSTTLATLEPPPAGTLPPTTPKSSSLGPSANGSAESPAPPVRAQDPPASTGPSTKVATTSSATEGAEEDVATVMAALANPTAAVRELAVSAGQSVEVILPNNEVELNAFVVPAAKTGSKYSFDWHLITHPKDSSGEMEGKYNKTLKLSRLTAGLYEFEVIVDGDGGHGEGYVNVTVKPEPRVNKPPVAVVSPTFQEITLPTSSTVIDGSQSSDDDKLVAWRWEEVKGPLRDEKVTGNTPILTLSRLVPGSYTFILTVTDSDGVQNSTQATLLVNKATDYKPVANAGPNQVITLPRNSITLYGNESTDDHEPLNYEWSLSPMSKAKVVEMQGVRTATLQLSAMQEGDYTFKLKVSDSSGQQDVALVTVIVQPEPRVNKPPVAVVSPTFQEITLPTSSTVIDGSQSSDDDKLVAWRWEEVKGPLRDEKVTGNTPILTLSRLVPGSYTFILTVTDSDGVQNSTQATLLVNKATDYKPVANAGPNQVITLPRNSITLYGNESTDDHEPLNYEWSLSPMSKAKVVEMQGVRTATLQLSAMQEGDYTFKLKVSDSSGQQDVALVTVIVQPENNKAPVAAAGPEKELTLPVDRTVLDGSKSSDDQKITTFHWKQSSGPDGVKIENAEGAVATVTGLQVGTYEFTLTVTDDRDLQSSDTVSVIVREEQDLPPVAHVLPCPPVVLSVCTAALDGSRSTDDKGGVSYLWSRAESSPAAGHVLNGSDHQPVLFLGNLVEGKYTFTLTVTDSKGQTSSNRGALEVKPEVSANLCRVTGGVLGMHWSSVLGLGWRPLARGNAGATCWQSCCLSPSCGAVWSLGGHCVQLSCSRDRGCAIDFLPQPHQESLGLLQMLDKGPVIQKRSVRQRRAHRTHPHVNTRSTTLATLEPPPAGALPPTTPKSSSLGPSANGSAESPALPVRAQDPPASTGPSTEVAATSSATEGAEEDVATVMAALANPTAAVRELAVSAGQSVEVILPNNEVELNAFVVPAAKTGSKYSFDWHLITHPKDSSGEMEGKYNKTLKLSRLTAGLYEFEVIVDGDGGHGEGYVNVTVKPEPRVNKPPVAVVSPTFQEITLPTSSTVIDGSQSSDDDKLVAWRWEEVKGPLRDEKVTGNTPILTLSRLVPGSYTFILTVTDSDGVQNSTQATLLVNKATDYKPVANAGPNQVITLPRNSITLYGNESTDDHEPLNYEWSLSPMSKAKVVEMQGVRTATLQLSAMQEGDYTFKLKVSDSSGQQDVALVTVIVQPENNKAPVAAAGPEKELTLPVDRTVLDGSKSSDDQKITTFHWKQSSGPDGVKIENAEGAVATVTGLQVGTYEFTLTVTDDRDLQSSDTVSVIVREEQDLPPVAHVLPCPPVVLPVCTAALDGSRSTDDKGGVSYLWSRAESSPAAGHVLNGSDHQPVLFLGNLVEGKYTFTLTVTDSKGQTSSDRGALEVKPEVSANLCRVTGGVLGMHWSSVLGLGWRPLARGNAGATCWQSCCLSPSCGAVWSLGGHCVQLSCSRDRGCAIDFLPQPHQESLGLLQMLDKGPVIQKRSVRQRRAHRTHPHVNTRSTTLATLEPPPAGALPPTTPKSSSLGPSANGSAESPAPPVRAQDPPASTGPSTEVAATSSATEGAEEDVATVMAALANPTAAVRELAVSAGQSVEVILPNNEVELNAFVVPAAKTGSKYSFDWHLITHPKDSSGEMEGKYNKTLKLSRLTAGLYEFEVIVDGDGGHGEGYVNVTVKPEPRVNKPPVAVVSPTFQEITLPTSSTVIDGSQSSDDDKLVTWRWEEVKGPLRDEKVTGNTPILTLSRLVPGSYTFILTVTDSDGVQNSTQATLLVNKATDYKPVANAGPNQVITLPRNSITLYGNESTDDHEPLNYEWSLSPMSKAKVVEMQGVRTATLQLSAMQEGDYTFKLKVSDSSGQQDVALVTVIVQPENNKAPVAAAGPEKELTLPVDRTVLDGSKSSDDQKITTFHWKQSSGPDGVKIENAEGAVATVTGLQVGTYEFTLTVTDDRDLQSSDTVSVIVREEQDLPPVAHVLPCPPVVLPVCTAALDGSRSTDDKGGVSYLWSRAESSPAAGHVLNGSDHQPVLFLGNLVEGKYTFTLTVTDSKGQTSSDRGALEVKPDLWAREEVELVLEVAVSQVTQRQRDMLLRQVGVLLGVLDSDIIVRDVGAFNEHSTRLVFLVSGGPGRPPLSGHSVATGLRNKLRKQKTEFLIFKAHRVDTVICQLNCSGHGACDAFTRSCVCQPFWMENFVRTQLGDGESNCEWSVLYVTIASFMIVVAIATVTWGMVCCCRRRRSRVRRSKSRYKMLEAEERDGLELQPGRATRLKAVPPPTSSALMRSDSDLDSDDGQGGVAWTDRERGQLLRPQNGTLRNGQGPTRGKKPQRDELL